MALATGQITIIDLSDSVSLQGYLSSNKPKIQFLATSGAYTPSWTSGDPVEITAELYRMGTADNIVTSATVTDIKWYANGTLITGSTSNYTLIASATGNQKHHKLRITSNVMNASNPALKITCEIKYKHGALPELTYKLDIDYGLTRQGATGAAGADAYTILLSNESHTFPADSNGNITSPLSTTTTVTAFRGTVSQTVTIGTLPTVPGLTLSRSGATVTIQANTGTSLAASGSFNIPITVDGRNFTKTFSWAKSNAGVAGLNAKVVSLEGDQIYSYASGSSTPIPTSLVLTARPQNTANSNATWQYQVPGGSVTTLSAQSGKVTFTTGATPTVTIAHDATVWGNHKTMTIIVTIDGVTDRRTIAKLHDGQNAFIAYLWAPEGEVFKNLLTNPSKPIEFKLFEGSIDRTSSVTGIKWFRQDPNAPGGWAQLTNVPNKWTGVTGTTLSVFADAIPSMEVFKFEGTYAGVTYTDTIVMTDQTDPYQVNIISTAGDIFKNGEGETLLIAKVFQGGEEIDLDGSKLVYTWSKYNKDGVIVSGWNPTKHPTNATTFKTIRVTAGDVQEKTTFFCDISKPTS